jgi:molybdate-binding protein
LPGLYDAVQIGFAAREQGLVVAPGNPLRLMRLADAKAKLARFVMRPEGAGAQQPLHALW